MELKGESCVVGPFVSLPPFLGRPSSPSGTDSGAWAPGPTAWVGAAAVDGCRAPPCARQATAAWASQQLRLLRGGSWRGETCAANPFLSDRRGVAPRSPELAKIELPLQRTLESSSLPGAPPPFDPRTPSALSLFLLPPRRLPCVGAGTRE
jgi:hypothetical protein